MPLDPAAAAVLDLIRRFGRPPLETMTPAEAREAMARSRAVLQPPGEPVAGVEDL
jgi:acetyl esterase